MSLKPTKENMFVVGTALSAKDWARHAIGSDKISGNEGFENYGSQGGWFYPMHYKYVRNSNPDRSLIGAVEEMSEVSGRLKDEILCMAETLDSMVMRLQRMEEQLSTRIEAEKELED